MAASASREPLRDEGFVWRHSPGIAPGLSQQDWDWNWWPSFLHVLSVGVGTICFFVCSCSLQKPQALPVDLKRASEASPAHKLQEKEAFIGAIKVLMTFLGVSANVTGAFGNTGSMLNFNIYACSVSEEPSPEKFVQNCSDNVFTWLFTCCFEYMNVWFMSLLFFVCGLSVPSSFDDKGLHEYLKGKFRRLGIGVLFWFFLFEPLLQVLIAAKIRGQPLSTKEYQRFICPDGVAWFILWLLTFHIFYAFTAHGPAVQAPAPSAGTVMTSAFAFGLFQSSLPHRFGPLNCTSMGCLMSYACFFSAGIVAKRNCWLDQLRCLPTSTTWFFRSCLLVIVLLRGWYHLNDHWAPPADHEWWRRQLGHPQELTMLSGAGSVLFAVLILHSSQREVSLGRMGNCLFRFCIQAQPLVYLMQSWVVVPILWSYVCILDSLGVNLSSLQSETPHGELAAVLMLSSSEGLLWSGWFYTMVLSTIILWPLAYWLRQLYPINQVL
eukprot:TRINITY_DN37166_c0_g1_i1.p1 TRINITY_DN37166_c0_g1~~TRINITY_DN37166_c0_g1_i1.p1  ORF type:complete len:493 (+),score=67.60 TRINITY_DN37166_c0_g1_i1:40-1518(+)